MQTLKLPDLDRLEALAKAMLNAPTAIKAEVAQQEFHEAATPAAVLALIALARRAQPEGEDSYTVDHRELAGKILSFSGISSRGSLEPGADPLADRLAEKLAGWGVAFAKPEGEAPQADWISAVLLDVAELPDRDSPEEWPEAMLVTGDELRRLIALHAPAAQHAESGAQVAIPTWQQRFKQAHPTSESAYWPDSLKVKYMDAEIDDLRAALAAQSQGALDWPHAPGRDEAQDAPPNPAQQAAAPCALDDLLPPLCIRNDRDMLNYLMTAFDNEIANCERCGHAEPTKNMDSASFLRDYLAAAPSAPGIPEAPKGGTA